mgnify:CR=1 FL=1
MIKSSELKILFRIAYYKKIDQLNLNVWKTLFSLVFQTLNDEVLSVLFLAFISEIIVSIE